MQPMAMASRPDWDIFCKVIDNLGDIGVCWRLARQLAGEHGLRVRLWVDDLESFSLLCPQLDPLRSLQRVLGIEVCRWATLFPAACPARVVLETFACRLPVSFVERMAQQSPSPAWINLDYLSAEDWVSSWHALPSPHPQLPLIKYFFFPGFSADTGGLLREQDLLARRAHVAANTELQIGVWDEVGFAPPPVGTLLISLFAYENPAIGDLLHAWESSDTPICCVVPLSRTLAAIEAFAGNRLGAGDSVCRGALDIRILPFLEQSRYDQLLWLCDLNFVRGEDSFVRAQWAARPLVWHIYPQENAAHRVKLDAFLALYCADLPTTSSAVLREFWQAWNLGRITIEHWRNFAQSIDRQRTHAQRWAERLARQDDLCTRLLCFSRSLL